MAVAAEDPEVAVTVTIGTDVMGDNEFALAKDESSVLSGIASNALVPL